MPKKVDFHRVVKEVIESPEFSAFLKSAEFCFYVINGGYEKIFCGKLAYYLALKLECGNERYFVCLEGIKRYDIVISEYLYTKAVFFIEVKHSFTTYHSDAKSRLSKDIKKLNDSDCDGKIIYLVSRIEKNKFSRGKSGGYKSKTDVDDAELEKIRDKINSLGFEDELISCGQSYSGSSETSVNIFFWNKG